MNQMRIKQNETGRSMVEMLGVLAVVGVLSIGGVAGYRYAVDKMNANEIINELKKRAITASQQRVLGQDINLAEYGMGAKIKGTYTVTPTTKYNGKASQFALAVSGVPERVCDMILESDWALPTEMAVNGGSCVEGANGNTMTFAFNNTLGSGDVGNGGNGEGNEGDNDPTDTPTQQCGENEYQGWDGTCQLDTNCSDPNQFYNARYGVRDCVSCPTEGMPVRNDASDIEDSCTKCPNAQVGGAPDNYHCVYCSSNRVVCGDQCCGEGQQCQYNNFTYQHECVSGLGPNGCLTNADCNKNGKTGEYCKNEMGCTQTVGTCESATLYNNGASIDVHGTTVYRSADDDMSWHAAKNFCEAHGMHLFNPNLQNYCTADEWSSIQSNSGGYCTAGEKNLKVTDDDDDWTGWTGSASGFCAAFYVHLYYGSVRSHLLVNDFYYGSALCEE